MFYAQTPEDMLRLGDVLKGYISTIPDIETPFIDKSTNDYRIDVNFPDFCAVLDNCCHIGKQTILLSPLLPIPFHFYDPPYLANDILTINLKGMPKDLIHPREWNEKVSDDKKREYLNSDPVFGYKTVFIYEKLAEFSSYHVKRDFIYKEVVDENTNLPIFNQIMQVCEFDTQRYMVDFKKSFRVNCRDLQKENLKASIIDSKVAQLTIETRNQLREKLGSFFGEVPLEDQ